MCYEFESWHWKARAKEMHKAQSKARADEPKSVPAKPAPEREVARPDVERTEKLPA